MSLLNLFEAKQILHHKARNRTLNKIYKSTNHEYDIKKDQNF